MGKITYLLKIATDENMVSTEDSMLFNMVAIY